MSAVAAGAQHAPDRVAPRTPPMVLVRRIGALVLVGAAVVVVFAFKPPHPDHAAERASIRARADLNNGTTTGAMQQEVVNGWENAEYQELLSKQLDDAQTARARDDRPMLLLALCVAGIALIAFTTPDNPRSRPDSSTRPEPSTAPESTFA